MPRPCSSAPTELKADGTTYNIDDEATFYLDSGLAELPPGGQADVSVAFDVPAGTVPQAIELHGDPMSPGVGCRCRSSERTWCGRPHHGRSTTEDFARACGAVRAESAAVQDSDPRIRRENLTEVVQYATQTARTGKTDVIVNTSRRGSS